MLQSGANQDAVEAQAIGCFDGCANSHIDLVCTQLALLLPRPGRLCLRSAFVQPLCLPTPLIDAQAGCAFVFADTPD